MLVAIQGQAGSFHDAVAHSWYGDTVEIVPCTTFADVFASYARGDSDAIVTAVENTLYGSINQVYQLVEACEAPIIGEYKLAIDQMLIGTAKHPDAITEIYSHPVALAQCRETLARVAPNAELIEFFDTAGAVEYIAETKKSHMAAIASEQAARLHQMPIIQHSIQDNKDNITRFLVLEPHETDPAANRASLVITTNHQPGALVEVLQVFAAKGINLAKLQSQPILGKPWQYKFFIVVDCAGEKLREVVAIIEQSDHEITLLGEYTAA